MNTKFWRERNVRRFRKKQVLYDSSVFQNILYPFLLYLSATVSTEYIPYTIRCTVNFAFVKPEDQEAREEC